MNEITKEKVPNAVCRLMTSIRNHTFDYEDQTAKITVSMGGAFFPEDADTKVDLIKAADQALYRAKGAGRDRFECCFDLSEDELNLIMGNLQHVDVDADPSAKQRLPNHPRLEADPNQTAPN